MAAPAAQQPRRKTKPVFMAVHKSDEDEPTGALLVNSKTLLEFSGPSGLDDMAVYIHTQVSDTRPVVTGCDTQSTPWYAVMMASVGRSGTDEATRALACGPRSIDLLFDFAVSHGFCATLESLLPANVFAAKTPAETCAQLKTVWESAMAKGYLAREAASGRLVIWSLCGSEVVAHSSGQLVVQRRFRSVEDCLSLLKSHPPDQEWMQQDALDLTAIYWGVHGVGLPRTTASLQPPSSPAAAAADEPAQAPMSL